MEHIDNHESKRAPYIKIIYKEKCVKAQDRY